MKDGRTVRFFLGANSKSGFYSLYDGFTDPGAGDFLWVLKGGPGCGKSTFMKRIGAAAELAGEPVEYILCSGDPDSLDGVYLPLRRVAYVDGTAPHVIECAYPGAASRYLDLSRYLDVDALRPALPEITELNRRYKALYQTAYERLAAGAALLEKNRSRLVDAEAQAKLDRRAHALAARVLPRGGGEGRLTRRFLSAWSCQGHLTLEETARALCGQVYALDNALGLGHVFLQRFAATALERGCRVILCPDPLEPEKPEALLLPEQSLALIAVDRSVSLTFAPDRRMHLDALAELPEERSALRQCRRESALLLSSAVASLADAKKLHDALEGCYRGHVDFDGLTALANAHIRRLYPD